MIEQAVTFLDRVEAVEFVLSRARPDMSPDARTREAILHALPAGDFHALDPVDAIAGIASRPRPGRAHNPIWTARRHGELIAATICSCAVRDLPLRMMAGAVREDFQGMRVARSLVAHIRESAPVVGAAVRVDRQDRRDRLTRWGFHHWYEGATGDIVVGFSQPVEPPEGLIFAVPIATDQEIAAGLARLATSDRQAGTPAAHIRPRAPLIQPMALPA